MEEGAWDGLLEGSLVDPGLVLAELEALSEGFGLDEGLLLAGDSLWEGLVEAEGVMLGAFVVSECLADVVGTDELGLLLGVVLCRINKVTFRVSDGTYMAVWLCSLVVLTGDGLADVLGYIKQLHALVTLSV